MAGKSLRDMSEPELFRLAIQMALMQTLSRQPLAQHCRPAASDEAGASRFSLEEVQDEFYGRFKAA